MPSKRQKKRKKKTTTDPERVAEPPTEDEAKN